MNNQSGAVTIEFLIAIAISFGLTIMTFALTFTLSVVEVAQYAVFSASRAHAAASYSPEAQQTAARLKYQSLMESSALKSLFKNGNWFEISAADQLEIRSGQGDNFEKDYAPSGSKNNLQGVRATLKVKLMEMRFPFLGSVTPDDNGFTTRLNALLIREVSQTECQKYMKDRMDQLWNMDGNRFQQFKKNAKQSLPTAWEDNGC